MYGDPSYQGAELRRVDGVASQGPDSKWEARSMIPKILANGEVESPFEAEVKYGNFALLLFVI